MPLLKRGMVNFEVYNHTQGIATAELGKIQVNCNRSDCKRSDCKRGTPAPRPAFTGEGRITVYLEKGVPVALRQQELKHFLRQKHLTNSNIIFSAHLELADYSN